MWPCAHLQMCCSSQASRLHPVGVPPSDRGTLLAGLAWQTSLQNHILGLCCLHRQAGLQPPKQLSGAGKHSCLPLRDGKQRHCHADHAQSCSGRPEPSSCCLHAAGVAAAMGAVCSEGHDLLLNTSARVHA